MSLSITIFFYVLGNEFNPDDPALNGSIAKVIFESAVENITDAFSVFIKMFQKAQEYNFAFDLATEIKK